MWFLATAHLQDRFALAAFTSGATESIVSTDAKATTAMTYIPDGGFVSSVDNSSVINSMYATKSGVIVFTSYKQGEPVTTNPLPKPNDAK